MAKQREGVCPGCRRHCPCGAERCNYGRKYFAAQAQKKKEEENGSHQYKWEKNVTRGSAIWQLLWTDCQLKKALKKEKCSEERLIAALDDSEKQQLDSILKKLHACLKHQEN